MKHTSTLTRLVAGTAVTAAGVLFLAPVSFAQSAGTNYTATLAPVNGSGASGTVTVVLDGNKATVTEHVDGLAAELPASLKGGPYPPVQHIHIDGKGVCPTMAADTNKDGILNTTEGGPSYGPIGTSLTLSGDTSPAAGTALTVAPTGASYDYSRTITLDAKSLASLTAGKGVIVVHGLDPAKLPAAGLKPSDLVPSLPLAATSPALCGTLVASQMTQTPAGGAQTGGGSTSGVQDAGMLVLGGGLIAGAGALVVGSRKRTATV